MGGILRFNSHSEKFCRTIQLLIRTPGGPEELGGKGSLCGKRQLSTEVPWLMVPTLGYHLTPTTLSVVGPPPTLQFSPFPLLWLRFPQWQLSGCRCHLRIQTACREELPCSGHEEHLCHMGPDPFDGLCGHLNFALLANASLQEALSHSFASFIGRISGASSFTFRFRQNYPPSPPTSNLETSYDF